MMKRQRTKGAVEHTAELLWHSGDICLKEGHIRNATAPRLLERRLYHFGCQISADDFALRHKQRQLGRLGSRATACIEHTRLRRDIVLDYFKGFAKNWFRKGSGKPFIFAGDAIKFFNERIMFGSFFQQHRKGIFSAEVWPQTRRLRQWWP